MNRLETIAKLSSSRSEWDAVVASLSVDRMQELTPGPGWTAKAIVAHDDFYEWWTGELLLIRTFPEVDERLNIVNQDKRNAGLNEIAQGWPLDDVMTNAPKQLQPLIAALEAMTVEDFANPDLLDFGLPGDWSPLNLVASSGRDHYPQHETNLLWVDGDLSWQCLGVESARLRFGIKVSSPGPE